MFLWLLGFENINNLIKINNHDSSFEWTKTDVILFWLPCLAILIIEKFKNRIISWFSHNTNLFWLDTLGSIALGFII